jgi:uncharacterized membrane protein
VILLKLKDLWVAITSEQAKKFWGAGVVSAVFSMAVLEVVYKLHDQGMGAIEKHEKVSEATHDRMEKTADERYAEAIRNQEIQNARLIRIQDETIETKKLVVTLIKEWRTDRRASLVPGLRWEAPKEEHAGMVVRKPNALFE